MQDSQFWNPLVPEISVTNFEKSLRFYTELCGFSVLFSRTEPAFAYLDQEGVQFMLEALQPDAWLTGELAVPFGRGINFQIRLDDIEPIYLRLKSVNTAFFRDIQTNWYAADGLLVGQKEFLVQDPDGYLLRFAQHAGERPLLA